jgi:hypothetical protein
MLGGNFLYSCLSILWGEGWEVGGFSLNNIYYTNNERTICTKISTISGGTTPKRH